VTIARLLPVPDDVSSPYWEAASHHILTAARCARCDLFTMPPDVVCPHCGSTDPGFTFTAVSGRGSVRSWTVVRQSFLSGFDEDLPFVLVDVELDEQPDLRVIGRLVDGLDASFDIGTRVTVTFEDLTAEIAVPAFEIAR
jgi:uncharacterized protein